MRFRSSLLLGFSALAASVTLQSPAHAQQFSLGTAQGFAVLGGSAVTNTGPTVINGDLGVSPGSAITGFPPGIVNGTIHTADAVALQAKNDLTTSYNVLAGLAPTQNLTGQDLGGMTLLPGIYNFTSSAQLTGTLTLDALGNPDSLFVFQIGSTLTTASNSNIIVTNGSGCNVFFQVGSSATLGTATGFEGNILALTSITLNTGATVENGRLLAQNGAVTLDTNVIDRANCDFDTGPAGTFSTTGGTGGPGGPGGTSPVPEPSEWLAMGMAGTSVMGLMIRARRRKISKGDATTA